MIFILLYKTLKHLFNSTHLSSVFGLLSKNKNNNNCYVQVRHTKQQEIKVEETKIT